MNAHVGLQGSRWSQRPPHECFDSVDELARHLRTRRARTNTIRVPLSDVHPVEHADGVGIRVNGTTLRPTAWAALQFSRLVGMPAKAVCALPPDIATAALCHRHRVVGTTHPDLEVELVCDHEDNFSRLHSIVGPRYARVWDAEVVESVLQPLEARGWKPATSVDAVDLRSALFSSDRDLFCFLIHEDDALSLDGLHPRSLRRGLIVRNSEVGGVALRIQSFWFDSWCTNHMILGARGVVDFRKVHRAGVHSPLARLLAEIEDWGGFDRMLVAPQAARETVGIASRYGLASCRGCRAEIVQEAVDATRQLAVRAINLAPGGNHPSAVIRRSGRVRPRTLDPLPFNRIFEDFKGLLEVEGRASDSGRVRPLPLDPPFNQ